MELRKSHGERAAARRWIPYIALGLSLVLTAAAVFYLRQTYEVNARLRFERRVAETRDSIESRIDSYVAVLRATGGLFATEGAVSRERFRSFVNTLDLDARYPGIYALGFVQRVRHENRDEFVASYRRYGLERFDIRPADIRPEYFPLVHIEPDSARNRAALGFDLSAEPLRREAMYRSRDTGNSAVSGKVPLIRDPDQEMEPGFVVFVPVFRGGRLPDTVEAKRENLEGFVGGAFRARDVFEGVIGPGTPPQIAFSLHSGTEANPDNFLYTSAPEPEGSYLPRRSLDSSIQVADRSWILSFVTLPEFETAGAEDQSLYVLLAGLLISGVLFAVTRSQVRAADEAEKTAASLQETQAAVRESERQYRDLVELSPEAIFIQCEGEYVYVNPATVTLLGAESAEDLIGRPVLDSVHPDYREIARERIRILREERMPVPLIEQRLIRLDGKPIEVEVAASPFLFRGEPAAQVLVRDITARRELESQFRQSQKMEAIGRLAGGVAHDFNNQLTAIIGYADFLKSCLADDDPGHTFADEIIRAGRRAADLTGQLLAFSRKQVLRPRVIDPAEIIRNDTIMLCRLIGEDVELVTKIDPSLGRVHADPGQIEQVLMNLAVNARDAMPDGGKLTIEATNTFLDEGYAAGHISMQPGPYVLLAVSDTGEGMDAETRSHIFEPFFTTKEKGRGTGLGLSTVYGIVKQSGGYIWVYSEPGRGTTFKIYLPRVEAPEEAEPKEPAVAVDAGGNETVLLVEDDEAVRKLALAALSTRGYTVLEAGGGVQALEEAGRHGGPIQLLVTDVVMPEISGRELASRLLARHPDMKILYVSGYTEDAVVHHGRLDPETEFLSKPFTTNELARRVRVLLDQR